MAKIKIPFNNKNYSIDEQSLSTASDAFKSHLQTVMNGTGATIKLGETAYNVDSTKLTATTNAFISHLKTIAGNGCKVVINGVEYNIDSTKLENAMTDITTVLNNFKSVQSDGHNSTWEIKNWNGYTSFSAGSIWSLDNNFYFMSSWNTYILNKETDTWENANFGWCEVFDPKRYSVSRVFVFNNNAYAIVKNRGKEYLHKLNKDTSTWEASTDDTSSRFLVSTQDAFVYEDNTYLSYGNNLYTLNKETGEWDLWKETIWNEESTYTYQAVWFYKGNAYYSLGADRQYKLNQETNTWEPIVWNGYSDLFGAYFWTDGEYIYYSEEETNGQPIQYVLNDETNTWEAKNWINFPSEYMYKYHLWTDGENIYISVSGNHYVLV